MTILEPFTCFLFDNGSLRPASTLALRRVARRLETAIGHKVHPVSLLHSNRVASAELNGEPAELLEDALRAFAEEGGRRAIALPLFFGPSGAMVEYLPPRIAALETEFSPLRVQLANCLESPHDDSAHVLAKTLAAEIDRLIEAGGVVSPEIIITDHGSPLVAVTQVRNRVGKAFHEQTGKPVTVASMERREGADFAFNEPLLERALATAGARGATDVIVALQFLFAGRHAGPEGDVVTICREATRKFPQLRIMTTRPMGESEAVLALLQRRLREVA